jgi:DNA polymerase type B, organellar and viral
MKNIISSKLVNLRTSLSINNLKDNLNNFLNRECKNKKFIQIIVKVKTTDNKFLSLSKSLVLNIHDKNELEKWKEKIVANFEQMNENYKPINIIQIIFQYQDIDMKNYKNNLWRNPWNIKKADSKLLDFPLTLNYDSYALTKEEKGNIIKYTDMIRFKDSKYAEMTVFKINENLYQVTLKIKNNEYVFVDQWNEDSKILTRQFMDGTVQNNKGWYYENISVNKTLTVLKNEYEKLLSKPFEYQEPDFKVITLDIETWCDNNKTLHIMSLAVYSKSLNLNKFFFIEDYGSELLMIKEVFKILTGYNEYNIYIHNGARFDLIFLINYIVELKDELKLDFEFIYKDGELLQISIFRGKNKIMIMDSFKLLLTSLDKLAKVFGIDEGKLIFPHGFSNPENFNYEGCLPDYSYFIIENKKLITKENYNNWNKLQSIWKFRDELMKYNIQDCKVLYEILHKFFVLILDHLNWNLSMNPTLSSLAFSLFRSSYIPESLKIEKTIKKGKMEYKYIDSKIQILNQEIDSFIRSSYFGGHVDAYIPHFDNSLPQWKDQILNHYDVVSLFPTAMENSDMPYSIKSYFKGDIRENNLDLYNNYLGFYRVNIMSPKEILNPIVPFKNDKGTVIYPTGYWGGIYFSEELKNAYKYGYRFEILEGYICERFNLFKSYINDLFKIKSESMKGSPMYLISKILMNSLYGKFGIRPDLLDYRLYENENLNNKNFFDQVKLTDKYSLVAFEDKYSDLLSNVAVSSAISSYGRVLMSNVKNNINNILFYSDTDSVFTNTPLSEDLVGSSLGKFTLENQFIKFICLGHKIYGGITTDGKEIIKIKGLSKENLPSYKDLETLLEYGKSLEKDNKKAFRNIKLGEIMIKNLSYVVQPTSNKRHFVYENNKIIGTKSINVWSPYKD